MRFDPFGGYIFAHGTVVDAENPGGLLFIRTFGGHAPGAHRELIQPIELANAVEHRGHGNRFVIIADVRHADGDQHIPAATFKEAQIVVRVVVIGDGQQAACAQPLQKGEHFARMRLVGTADNATVTWPDLL